MFVKRYVLEFGNADFYLQVVVNLGHLSKLNFLQSCCSYVSFLSCVEVPSPSGQNQLAASTLQTVIFGFGLHAKLAHPITGAVVFFRSCTRLVMS